MQVFIQGELNMSTSPWTEAAGSMGWGGIITNQILVAACGIAFILLIPDILMLTGQLFDSLMRERTAVKLEHSINTARTRNHLALFFILPTGLIMDRFQLYRPEFFSPIPDYLTSPANIGVLLSYTLVHSILFNLLGPRRAGAEQAAIIHHNMYNYFIIFAMTAALTAAVMPFFKPGLGIMQAVLYAEAAILFVMGFVRTGQFLGQNCGGFSTFLYLCGLELAPAAILVASAILL